MHTLSSFFFIVTATTEFYTLSLHDALPISRGGVGDGGHSSPPVSSAGSSPAISSAFTPPVASDRKSTRLNSSHGYISYAVFCLKKKNTQHIHTLSPAHGQG